MSGNLSEDGDEVPTEVRFAEKEEKGTETPALTLEQQYEKAIKVLCPISKFTGKTLGDVLTMEPGAVKWLATKYTKDPEVQKAAQIICDYAMEQAS